MHSIRLEKLRREITSDIHDDIGATLSSINIYAELAKTEKNNASFIESIQKNTLDALSNLDDLVWNINQKSESLGLLLQRMKAFAIPLLAAKNINSEFVVNIENNDLCPPAHKTSHIYFTLKELINNIARHSGAQNCKVYIFQKYHNFELKVIDDGKGFEISELNKMGNGLENISERAKELSGRFIIDSKLGKGTVSSFIVDL